MQLFWRPYPSGQLLNIVNWIQIKFWGWMSVKGYNQLHEVLIFSRTLYHSYSFHFVVLYWICYPRHAQASKTASHNNRSIFSNILELKHGLRLNSVNGWIKGLMQEPFECYIVAVIKNLLKVWKAWKADHQSSMSLKWNDRSKSKYIIKKINRQRNSQKSRENNKNDRQVFHNNEFIERSFFTF